MRLERERTKTRLRRAIIKGNSAAKELFSIIVDAVTTVIWIILWMPVAFLTAMTPSYYPELERKCAAQRISENIVWVLKYHRANTFYMLYGLDVKGRSSEEYIDENSFWKKLDYINYNRGLISQTCLLRNKFLFYKYMSANKLPVPEVFGVIKDGAYYTNQLEKCPITDLRNETDYFLKDANGECASFVKHIKSYHELEQICKSLQKGFYVLQRAVHQADALNTLNPGAINTLRIVTLKTDDGWLKKYGLYKPGYGSKASVHPDTGIAFESFAIPFIKEAYELAVAAHKFFYNIGAIGWDVAITDNGPVFIEGNDNFEITLMQACDRPLKHELMKG